MDSARLAEIRERLSKATPGPWGHFVAEWRPATPVAVHRIGSNETGEDIACVYLTRPSDAELIAHAPEDLADLLAELDRATLPAFLAERAAEIACYHADRTVTVAGHPGGSSTRDGSAGYGTTAEWRAAMGIDWMTARELAQAIPPAYTEHIGAALLTAIERAA